MERGHIRRKPRHRAGGRPLSLGGRDAKPKSKTHGKKARGLSRNEIQSPVKRPKTRKPTIRKTQRDGARKSCRKIWPTPTCAGDSPRETGTLALQRACPRILWRMRKAGCWLLRNDKPPWKKISRPHGPKIRRRRNEKRRFPHREPTTEYKPPEKSTRRRSQPSARGRRWLLPSRQTRTSRVIVWSAASWCRKSTRSPEFHFAPNTS